jgi:hypothetical protein
LPYSTRFFAEAISAEVNPAYTVPSGFVAVLRDLELYNETGDTDTLNCELTIPGPLNVIMYSAAEVPTYQSVQWRGRVVLNAGDVLWFYAGHYPWQVVASGYLLSSS